MLLDIEHKLGFKYSNFISESAMELRIEPQTNNHQTVRSFYMAVGPVTKVFRYLNWNGLSVHHFSITDYHDRIEVVSRSIVETHPKHSLLSDVVDDMSTVNACGSMMDFVSFGGPVIDSPFIRGLLSELSFESNHLGFRVAALDDLVKSRIKYRPNVTDFASTSDDALRHGYGVCQDYAHVLLALLRLNGIPCRYVSGYLHVTDRGRPSESHAWVEFFSPTLGWVGYDPTHHCIPDERYVSIGTGRNYDDVAPNRGIYVGNAKELLSAEVNTKEVKPEAIVDIREDIGRIEVPVYSEMPVSLRAPGNSEVHTHQQAQQQQ